MLKKSRDNIILSMLHDSKQSEQLERWANASVAQNTETELIRFLRSPDRKGDRDSISDSRSLDSLIDFLYTEKISSRGIFEFSGRIESSELNEAQIQRFYIDISSLPTVRDGQVAGLIGLLKENPVEQVASGLHTLFKAVSGDRREHLPRLLDSLSSYRFATRGNSATSKRISHKCFAALCSTHENLGFEPQPFFEQTQQICSLTSLVAANKLGSLEQVIDSLADSPEIYAGLTFRETDLLNNLTSILETVGPEDYLPFSKFFVDLYSCVNSQPDECCRFVSTLANCLPFLRPVDLHFPKLVGCLEQRFCVEHLEPTVDSSFSILKELVEQAVILNAVTVGDSALYQDMQEYNHNFQSIDNFLRSLLPSSGIESPSERNQIEPGGVHNQTRSTYRKAFDASLNFQNFTYVFRSVPDASTDGESSLRLIDEFVETTGIKCERASTVSGNFLGDGWRLSELTAEGIFLLGSAPDETSWDAFLGYMQRQSRSGEEGTNPLSNLEKSSFCFFQGLIAISADPQLPAFTINGTHYSLVVLNHQRHYENSDTAILVPTENLKRVMDDRFAGPHSQLGLSVSDFSAEPGSPQIINLGWGRNYFTTLAENFRYRPYDPGTSLIPFFPAATTGGSSGHTSAATDLGLGSFAEHAHNRIFETAQGYFDLLDLFKISLSQSNLGRLPKQLKQTAAEPASMPILRQTANWIVAGLNERDKDPQLYPVLVIEPIRRTPPETATTFVLDTSNRLFWRHGVAPEFIDLDSTDQLSSESVSFILKEYDKRFAKDADLEIRLMDRAPYLKTMQAMGAKNL